MTRYISGGRIFHTMSEAVAHANWLFKVSGLIVAVEAINEEKGAKHG